MHPLFARLTVALALLAALASAAPTSARRSRDVRPVRPAVARATRALLQRPDSEAASVDPDGARYVDASDARGEVWTGPPNESQSSPDPAIPARPSRTFGRDTAVSRLRCPTTPPKITPVHAQGSSPRGPPHQS